jgi:shikimate kinase
MGTGKTTVGRTVANRIGFKCSDSDHEIERASGKTIARIFAEDGEAAFRKLEREYMESGHAAERVVVACGGGLVVQPGMLELVASKGVIVCLHASIETILIRTGRYGKTRPLLDVEDPDARARALYAEREAIYRSAGTVILTDSRPLSEIAAHVIRVWRRESADFARRHARSAG